MSPTSGWGPLPVGAHFQFWAQVPFWTHFRFRPTSGTGPKPEIELYNITQKCNKTSCCIVAWSRLTLYFLLKDIKTSFFSEIFSLFTIVTFPNEYVYNFLSIYLHTYILMWFHNLLFFYKSQCTAISDSTMFGTCYAETECSSKGGTVDGNCAAGFGVCCTFV